MRQWKIAMPTSPASVAGRIKGSLTALITPMKDGKLDEAAFRKLVSWQIAEGTQGLVPCGTTGESPTLSHDEHRRVIEICVEETAGRVPVIAGAGSNSTTEAIALSRRRRGSTVISWRWPMRSIFPSSSTTSRRAPLSRFPSRPWPGWRGIPTSSG
jgi:hypothetical protein